VFILLHSRLAAFAAAITAATTITTDALLLFAAAATAGVAVAVLRSPAQQLSLATQSLTCGHNVTQLIYVLHNVIAFVR
jgi:hypothetical protein